jgi:TatD DNase family protein
MRLIDTHAHLYLEEFDQDIDNIINRSIRAEVDRIVLPNIDSLTLEPMDQLVKRFSENCFQLIGLHPTHVKENYLTELGNVLNKFEKDRYVGIGEIGIDLYWDKTYLKEQIYVFENQLSFALTNNLPVVIHARDSFEVIYESISKTEFTEVHGIFHAFAGNIEQAEKIIQKGYLIGIGGVVTFKNSKLAEVVKSVDLEHIVLETDSPYLTPAPYRGQRNESSYIRIIADKIAEVKGISVEQVAEVTTRNAIMLFGL